MTLKEKIDNLNEIKNPSLKMQKVLADIAIAEAVVKMDFFKGIKGETGEPGYSPVKGKDYYTETDINTVVNHIQSKVKDGKDGAKGEPGKNGETPLRGVDYWTEKDKERIIKDTLSLIKIPTPKDGISPKIEEVVNLAVDELKKKPLHLQDIKGTKELIEFLKLGGFRGGGSSGGGSVSPLTTKGDLYTFSTVDARLAVGTNGYVLSADSSTSTGLKWIPAGGSVGPGTINEIAYFDTTTSIASLAVATYPSLTELSYVKGVTSAIQTQINTKQATITFGTNVQTALGVNVGSAGAFITFNGDAGTPSALVGTNISGTGASFTAGKATILATARTIGGVSFDGSAAITVATATGGFTVSGGNLVLGANSLTMTGNLASGLSPVTAGFFTDLTVTNAIAGSITGNAATVSSANEATDTTCFPLFITASGTQTLATKNNTGFTYNSNTNAVAATTFVGALTGTASGNVTTIGITTANGVSGSSSGGQTPSLTVTLGAITPTTVNGNTFTTGTYTLTGQAGKTLTFNGSITLTGTDAQTYTFPTTSATIARIDAANTFVGASTATSWVFTTPVLGTPTSGTLTNCTGLPAASVVAGTLGSGSYTMSANLTVLQVINTSNAIAAAGNAATVPITSRISTVTNNSAATLTITITTTSAVDGQLVQVRVLDFSAAAQTITWVNTENGEGTVPASSNGSTTLPRSALFQFNNATTKWRCIAA